MKFEFVGTGGCVALPRPLCGCPVCVEARDKGRPYSRNGCSLYLHDAALLIDTPEDIAVALNNSDIERIENVLYTHLDPDHTLGLRVFEQLRLNWFDVYDGRECDNPISVYAMPHVMDDLNMIRSKYGAFFDYYEKDRCLVKRQTVSESIALGDINVTLVAIGSSSIFVFEEGDKKLIYGPCDIKPFPEHQLFEGADILIIGDTIIGETMKGGYQLQRDNKLYDDLFHMSEVLAIKERYGIKQVIITHIEEDWGKSYDDLKELEKNYKDLTFAYDGMTVTL